MKPDTLDKANVCNRQFQSAFTRESDDEIPSKGTSPFTPMGEITVDPNGVLKLLNNLKVHKAPGPDGLSARLLKECSSEIAPILALIYNETLAQGTVPDRAVGGRTGLVVRASDSGSGDPGSILGRVGVLFP